MASIEGRSAAAEQWNSMFASIRDAAAARAPNLRRDQLERLSATDVEHLFAAVDHVAFGGALNALLRRRRAPLTFRLGKRMTSSGGTTTRFQDARNPDSLRFEIAIAPRLLFTTFQLAPAANVCGCECRSTREALQRVMEHEAVHLLEMLVWTTSSCRRQRFRSITHRCFGHRASTHSLITPTQMAAQYYAIRIGDVVEFEFEGRSLTGVVNRITRRATILVPDRRGQRYSDGARYRKYYVPMEMLTRSTSK